MDNLQKLIALQKKEGWTDYEMGLLLAVPENTWKQWKASRRRPRGPALTMIEFALAALHGTPVTREQLLAKTGRTGKLSAETISKINKEQQDV